MSIDGGNAESLRTSVGMKVSYDWKIGGFVIKPQVRAAWQHEFGDTTYTLDSSFANGAGASFAVDGPRIGRDSVLLSGGFAIQVNDRASIYAYYDGELGRKNYHATSVTGGFSIQF